MKVKKYSAESLRAALRLARIELGSDATLIDSKELEDGDTPRFEATFAVHSEEVGRLGDNRTPDGRHWRSYVPPQLNAADNPGALEAAPRASARSSRLSDAADGGGSAAAPAMALEQVAAELTESPPDSAAIENDRSEGREGRRTLQFPQTRPQREGDPSLQAILVQLRALHSAVEELRKSAQPVSKSKPESTSPTPAQQALQSLLAKGLDPETWPDLEELLEREAERNGNALELTAWLRAQVSARWNIAPGLGAGSDSLAVAAFIGPSGAGKTSSLLKLAVQQGLRRQRSAHLILADPIRWGSAEALGAQAESAGALLTVAQGPDDLGRKLERIRNDSADNSIILIDTPSYGPSESTRAADMAAALLDAGGIETHLTLNASVGDAELRRAAEGAVLFAPSRLLFTHLDVSTRPGAIWNESSRSSLPISFLGTGPKTPEDLRTANPGRLTNLLFSR